MDIEPHPILLCLRYVITRRVLLEDVRAAVEMDQGLLQDLLDVDIAADFHSLKQEGKGQLPSEVMAVPTITVLECLFASFHRRY